MRVLILGGSGFIGSFVVGELVKNNHYVIVVHRGRSSLESSEHISSLVFSRENIAEFAPQIRKSAPDVVIDMIPKTARPALRGI